MPIHEIMRYLGSADVMEQLEMLLALHSAPILYGIKLANLIRLTRRQRIAICHCFPTAGIYVWVLSCNGDENQVLLYRRAEMQETLWQKRIQEIMRQFGYTEFQVISVLLRLSGRLQRHQLGLGEFPHEIGILLGYPVDDVMGFLENQGKNYAYCGYWKVYKNVEQAKRQFAAYDQVREAAVLNVLNGRSWMHR